MFRWTSDSALSEVGTVQIEMRDLSRVSGDKKYEVIPYPLDYQAERMVCLSFA